MLWIYHLKTLLLPPGLNALLLLLAVLLRWRFKKTAHGLVWLSLLSLMVLSLPAVSLPLARGLEQSNPPLAATSAVPPGAQALVILSGGVYPPMPEYGAAVPRAASLERLRYGAWLQRRWQLPLLLSGGSVFEQGPPEALLMAQVLETDFNLHPTWLETTSRNTAENASASWQLLQANGIQRIVLVTQALHMPRAQLMFRQAGFEVVPAPTIFATTAAELPGLMAWLPSMQALLLSHAALHEYLGIYWYRWRYPGD